MTTSCAINLVPRRRLAAYRGATRVRGWGVVLGLYACVVGVACVAAKLTLGQNLAPLYADAAATEQKVQGGEKNLSAARAKLREALSRQATVKEVLDHPDLGTLVAIISRRLGEDVVLRDLHAWSQKGGAAGSGVARTVANASERVFKLELRGLGKSPVEVGKFVSAMEGTKLFDRVVLMRSAREPFGTGMTATSFEIECTIADGGQR